MATTKELSVRFDGNELPPVEVTTDAGQPPLLAGEKILKGTFAMISSGKIQNAVANPGATAALMGIAQDTYDNSAAGAVDVLKNMVFRRGACWMKSKAGDLPDASTMMRSIVYVQDNEQVGKTSGGANAFALKQLGFTATETKVLVS